MYLRTLLRDAGVNPKNNGVDISNLLMVLFGQPTHFFDTSCIEGNIIVRDAKAGEEFVDLTGKKHSLTEDDIVIADEKKVLALA
jgi:phenylalanyl-tRNA synthetase beta chain